MSVIKTPQGMFIVCPKGGHNVVRRVTPPPVTTVHMQVREHSNYMDEKATWTRVGRYHYFTSQFLLKKIINLSSSRVYEPIYVKNMYYVN